MVSGTKGPLAKAVLHFAVAEPTAVGMEQLAIMQNLRRKVLPREIKIALDDIFLDPGALIVHGNSPLALDKVWPLCDEMASRCENSYHTYKRPQGCMGA